MQTDIVISKFSVKQTCLFLFSFFTITSVYSQFDGNVSAGIEYYGIKKQWRLGYFAGLNIPVKSSEFRFEYSHFSSPYNDFAPYNATSNLKISSVEIDYIYTGRLKFRELCGGKDRVFTSIGCGLNCNFLSGGSVGKITTVAHPGPNQFANDSAYYQPIDNEAAIGFGLFMGFGYCFLTKFSVFADYSVKCILYTYNKEYKEMGIVMGGVRLGVRFHPFKKQSTNK